MVRQQQGDLTVVCSPPRICQRVVPSLLFLVPRRLEKPLGDQLLLRPIISRRRRDIRQTVRPRLVAEHVRHVLDVRQRRSRNPKPQRLAAGDREWLGGLPRVLVHALKLRWRENRHQVIVPIIEPRR